MNKKIKILFYNRDKAGVNYFRTQTPATQLERDHSDSFDIEITNQLDFSKEETLEYLKGFDIIHYHRILVNGIDNIKTIYPHLKAAGVTLIADVDDYWYLDKTHPYYSIALEQKMHEEIIISLKLSDYVTTTTDVFADEIKELTKEDNVVVLPNSIDPTWMTQFKDEWKPSEDGLVRINYIAGSSHGEDIQLLNGVVNRLQADPQTKDKFKIMVTGWDDEGSTKDVTFNEEFSKELEARGLWNRDMVKQINKSRGNVDFIVGLPDDLVHKYRNKIFFSKDRKINSDESIYFHYEKTLTDNHKLIDDTEYVNWLMKFERGRYKNEGNFARIWTEKANVYAKALNETDISIAPLLDHKFNRCKCVTYDTLISTNNGIFKIGDIVDNNINNLKSLNFDIINHFKYKDEKTIKLITDYGFEIEGTENHRILINDEWKRLDEFNVGDMINIQPFEYESDTYQKISYPSLLSKKVTKEVIDNSDINMIPSIIINEDWGRFFGYMLGDGHFSKGYLRISCDKRHVDVVDDVTDLVKRMGLNPILIEKKPDKRCKNSHIKEGYGVDISIPSKHLSEICYQENLRNENGKVFEIPHFILKSPKSVIREFLIGLFEADGTNVSCGVSLTTKSNTLAKQIQYLLLGFNIIGKIKKVHNKKYSRNYWEVRLNRDATDKFNREIGFISKHKKEKLNETSNKKHSNAYKEQEFKSYISSIEYNVSDVYDIEVNDIHQYNGNGIINHNSNLKQVECWTRKIPIVCSDVVPYNVDGVHEKNCLLIPNNKKSDKLWYKALKKLIISEDYRKQLGQTLYEDFKEKFNLKVVTDRRSDFYKNILKTK